MLLTFLQFQFQNSHPLPRAPCDKLTTFLGFHARVCVNILPAGIKFRKLLPSLPTGRMFAAGSVPWLSLSKLLPLPSRAQATSRSYLAGRRAPARSECNRILPLPTTGKPLGTTLGRRVRLPVLLRRGKNFVVIIQTTSSSSSDTPRHLCLSRRILGSIGNRMRSRAGGELPR